MSMIWTVCNVVLIVTPFALLLLNLADASLGDSAGRISRPTESCLGITSFCTARKSVVFAPLERADPLSRVASTTFDTAL